MSEGFDAPAAQGMPSRGGMRRLWPVLALVGLAAAAYAFGLHRYLSFEYLGRQQQALAALVAAHPAAAVGCYLLAYVTAVLLLFPGTPVLTVAGGLLFGALPGAACAVLGATGGAVCLLLLLRRVFAGWLGGRGVRLVERVRPGLERDGFLYLLAARLLPVFPFWLVNLAAAAAGMRPGTFAAGTALGVTPSCLVYASVGAGLGGALAEGRQPSLPGIVLRPEVLLPLAALALLSLGPILWRRVRGQAPPLG